MTNYLQMTTFMLSVFLITCPALAISAEQAETESDEEECIYDQDEQVNAYLELEKKYPGSRYVEDKYELQIPENGDQVTLRRGGCVHFGIYIEFRTARTEQFEDESAFFAKVSDLIGDYGQKLLEPAMLENSRAKQSVEIVELHDGVYYVLPHPDAVFETWRRHDEEHTTIGVSFYY
jgi:hypothetical protein